MATKPGGYGATSHRGGERQLKAAGDRQSTPGKGSTRPDDRIRADIQDGLSGEPQLDAARIEVKVEDGEVTLTGSVADRWGLEQAEALVRRVNGVKNVRNALRIELHGVGTTLNATPSDRTGPNRGGPKG
jgi:osmotically-inducible protein OsmY